MEQPFSRDSRRTVLRTRVTDIYIIIMLLIFPLFTGFSGYSNITFSKYIFFVAATGLWLLLLSAISLKDLKGFELPSPAQCCALAFIAVSIISWLLSPWRAESLVGAGRYDGLITQLLYLLIFLGVSSFTRPKPVHAAAFGLSVTLCSLVSVFQIFNVNIFSLFPADYSYYDAGIRYSSRFLGTIGNTNILASVLCLAAPMFLGFFICGSGKYRPLCLIPVFLSVLILVLSGSEGGLLGLAVCALIGAPVVCTDMLRLRRALAALAVPCLAAALALAFDPVYSGAELSWNWNLHGLPLVFTASAALCLMISLFLQKLRRAPSKKALRLFLSALSLLILAAGLTAAYFWPGGGTMYELSQLLHGRWDDSFGSSRLLIWRSCMELVGERPLLGGGPGTLPLRLDINFSRFVEETGKTLRSSVDNAHNEYLSCLVNTGLAGLLSYLSILTTSFVRWLKNVHCALPTAIGLGLAACCVQGFFGLGLCISAPIFWIFLGLIQSSHSAESLASGGQHEK